MARQFEPFILLGFEDGRVAERTKFDVNKIGGTPDWHQDSDLPSTRCKLCGTNQALVVQIYAPLDGSAFERTLYFFACPQPLCWNRPESWMCIRQQSLSEETPTLKKSSEAALSTTYNHSSWDAEADNWGNNSDEEEEIVPSVDQENGNIIFRNPPPEDPDTDDESSSVEELSDPNANSGGAEGAFAVEFNSKCTVATAEIETGEESDIVSIDTPTQPRQQLAEIFSYSPLAKNAHYEFACSYISTSLETFDTHRGAKITEHELALLQAYQQSELGGGDVKIDVRKMKVEVAGGAETTGEQYEQDLPSHGDALAHRFYSRLKLNPEQAIRYGLGADPMLLKPLPKQKMRCTCGSDLVFEAQLMPPLLNCLSLVHAGADRQEVLDFGTVIAFTCPSACWDQGRGFQEERLIVQAE